jgi:hypothetical protein
MHTDKKDNKTFLRNKKNQKGSGVKSFMRKGVLIYEEMSKYLTKYEEADKKENFLFLFYQCSYLPF